MEFERLLELVGNEPVFETALLLAGNINPNGVRLQLSRWTKSGRLYQLRRGLYALAPPYQKVKPHPFLIANRLQRASYVSSQSVLAYYGLIPDIVHIIQSVTAGRPKRMETPLGVFEYQHVKTSLLHGYQRMDLGDGQHAFAAKPEKALLDLIYLTPGGDRPDYLQELRLQNLGLLNMEELHRQSTVFASPKLDRAVRVIKQLAEEESRDFENC